MIKARKTNGVLTEDFRSAIPAGDHIVRLIGQLVIELTGETKVANRKIAVAVYENVGRLQITMENTCGMKKLHSFEKLEHEKLNMTFG